MKYLDTNNLFSHVISKFLPTVRLKWIDPQEFDSVKYSSNNSKSCVFGVNLEYPKELLELYYECPLASDEIEIKK